MGGRLRPMMHDDHAAGPRLWIPGRLASSTARLLRTYGGLDEHEGIVYWGGIETHEGAVGLVALSPVAATTWGSFQTDADAHAGLVSHLARLNLTLVAQIHSHPGEWVDHSDGDDVGALVRFPGFWSIVVPRFAREGMLEPARLGIHLFQDGAFRRLGATAVASRVRVLPSLVDLRKTMV
jgi:hypothetical protein